MLAATTPILRIDCGGASDKLFEDIKKCRCEIRQRTTLLQVDWSSSDPHSPIVIDGKVVSIHLTQEQTALFQRGDAKVQLHFLLADGKAWKTLPATIKVGESLSQEILK